jgi:hypothetical protein
LRTEMAALSILEPRCYSFHDQGQGWTSRPE